MSEEDEEQLAPLPQHVLDMVPPDIHKLFRDILKYRVDAAGEYYGVTADTLIQSIHGLKQDTVAAIAIEPGETKYNHTVMESLNIKDLSIFKEIYSRLMK